MRENRVHFLSDRPGDRSRPTVTGFNTLCSTEQAMFDDLSTKTQACMAMGLFCVAVIWALYRIYSKDQDVNGRPVLRQLKPEEIAGITHGIPPVETFQKVFGDSLAEYAQRHPKRQRNEEEEEGTVGCDTDARGRNGIRKQKEKRSAGERTARLRRGITKKRHTHHTEEKTRSFRDKEEWYAM